MYGAPVLPCPALTCPCRQLLYGAPDSELSKLRLVRDAGQYYYTRQGGNTRVDSISDRQDYKSVSAALRLLGFSPEKTDCIWRTIAAVLNLVSGQLAPRDGGTRVEEGIALASDPSDPIPVQKIWWSSLEDG